MLSPRPPTLWLFLGSGDEEGLRCGWVLGGPRGPGVRSQVLQRRPGAKPLMGTGKGAKKGPGQLASPGPGQGSGQEGRRCTGGASGSRWKPSHGLGLPSYRKGLSQKSLACHGGAEMRC